MLLRVNEMGFDAHIASASFPYEIRISMLIETCESRGVHMHLNRTLIALTKVHRLLPITIVVQDDWRVIKLPQFVFLLWTAIFKSQIAHLLRHTLRSFVASVLFSYSVWPVCVCNCRHYLVTVVVKVSG